MSNVETIIRFVGQLSGKEVREQLRLAYLQMERCQQVLRGQDVEPVDMMDNGLSSDLELFYLCKKKSRELGFLEDKRNEEEIIKFKVEADFSDVEKQIRNIEKKFEHFRKFAADVFKPSKEMFDVRKETLSNKPLPVVGEEAWFWRDMLTCSKIKSIELNSGQTTIILEDGSVFKGWGGLFRTHEDLINRLKEYLDEQE